MRNERVKNKKFLIVFSVISLLFFALALPCRAEFDKTRKMKAEAEHYFEAEEYYKAIDIWAEVLKIDSYDREALEGIAKAQKIIEETKGEKERAKRKRLKELIQEGKNFYRDKEYRKALSSWGEALSFDPVNKEVLDLIEEARIRAQYQISILDKLDREKRLKTPHLDNLDKMAEKMIDLLEKVDTKTKEVERKRIEKEVEKEIKEGIELGQLSEQKPEIEKPKKEKQEPELEKGQETQFQPPRLIWLRDRQDLLRIGIIFLLVFLLVVRITTRRKVKPYAGKTPPKRLKKEEAFEPRDLKKFLKKKPEDKDKDLFK